MVVIRSPQYWQSKKPPFGSKINWNHPLSSGLQGCFLFNEPCGPASYNLVTVDITKRVYNRPYILPTTITRGYDSKGSFIAAPTVNTVITHDNTIKLYHGKSPSTFYCGVRSTYSPYVNWNTIWASSNAEMGYGIMFGGKPFVYAGGGTEYSDCYATLTAYKYHQIGYIGVTGGGTTHYIDGVIDRNVYTGIVDYPIYGFCGTTTNYEPLRGNLYFAYFWGGFNIPLKEVNKNPYQFIIPSKNRKIFLAAPERGLNAGLMEATTVSKEYPNILPVRAPNLSDQINSFSFATETGELLPNLMVEDTGDFDTFPEGEAFPSLQQIELFPRPIITVSAGTIWELASAIAGSSTATSDVVALMDLLTSISGTSTVTAQVVALQKLVAALSGTTTVTSTVSIDRLLTSAIAGTGSITAALTLLAEVQAAISGLSGVSPTLSAINFVNASVAGSSSITAALTLIRFLLSGINGTATVTVSATAYGNLTSTVAGSCSVVPTLTLNAALSCNTDGTCSISGIVNATQLLTAAIAAGATIEVSLTGANALVANINGTSSTGITLKLDSALLASILGSGSIAAEVALYRALIAAIDGLSSTQLAELSISGTQLLAALVDGTSTVIGSIKIDASLVSAIAGSSQLSSLIRQLISLETSITGLGSLNIVTRFVLLKAVLLKALIEGNASMELKRFLAYVTPITSFKFLKATDHQPYK